MLVAEFQQYFFGFSIFITSLFLVMLVLVQRGRGGGLTGALGGAGGQSAFGTKAGDLFTRITVGVAALWIFLCAAAVFFLRDRALPQTGVDDRDIPTATATGALTPGAQPPVTSGLGGESPTGGDLGAAGVLNGTTPPTPTPPATNGPTAETTKPEVPAAGVSSTAVESLDAEASAAETSDTETSDAETSDAETPQLEPAPGAADAGPASPQKAAPTADE